VEVGREKPVKSAAASDLDGVGNHQVSANDGEIGHPYAGGSPAVEDLAERVAGLRQLDGQILSRSIPRLAQLPQLGPICAFFAPFIGHKSIVSKARSFANAM
jgi:hypothetical protein